MFVTKGDGTTRQLLITGQSRPSGSIRGRRKSKRKPPKVRERKLTNVQPTPAKVATTRGKRRAKSRKRSVDHFATTSKDDRPLTSEQRSALAALARDPYLNFTGWQTLTKGEADRLIPRLRRLAKQRSDAHLSKRKPRNKRGSR